MNRKSVISIVLLMFVSACTNKNSEQKNIDSIAGSDTVKFNWPFYGIEKIIFNFEKCTNFKDYVITNSRNEILYQ